LKNRFKPYINTNSGRQTGYGSILIGRLVTEGHEPRQVRKEAAISDLFCVKDRSRSCNLSASPAGRFIFSHRFLCLDMQSNRLTFQP